MKRVVAAAASAAFFLAATPVFAACITDSCHPGLGKIAFPHQPVKDGDCTACHEQVTKEHPVKGAKTFKVPAKIGELCLQCHDGVGKKKMVHPPLADGDCLACHKPHGGSSRYLLDVSGDLTALCTGCHDDKMFRQEYMHGPAAVGACTECHDPHAADEKALMKIKVRDACLRCHADFAGAMAKAGFVHPPVKNDPCTTCHEPHGSASKFVLKKKMPDLCIGCHVEIGKKYAAAKVPHKPLHEGNICGNCHSSHFSKGRGLFLGTEKELCLSCHGRDNLGTPALKNIKKEIDGKKVIHGPIRKDSCSACHDPHGGEYFRMLPGNYPQSFYAEYEDGAYGACLKCHEKNLLKYADTSLYTNFRNGKENLHYVHVTNKRKGRSCRACHDPHGSSGEKLISQEGAAFGEWKIPTRFTASPSGGSCAPGCHRPLKYDRDNPVSYTFDK